MRGTDVNPKSLPGGGLSAQQARMARAGLGVGVRELANAAGVSTNTITRLLRGEQLQPRTVAAVRAAFEAWGAEFIDGEAPGVRMRTRQ